MGLYLHSKYRKRYSHLEADVMYNDETDARKVFEFLCSSKQVITSSYHGALWATYLNKTVWITDAFSEKFQKMPFQLPSWPDQPAKEIDGVFYRDQCRRENIEFYSQYLKHAVARIVGSAD
jgi:hypothetical protein